MKKQLAIFSLCLLIIVSCKKTGFSPIGPTDIRVKNITNVPMSNVTVNTFDSTYNYGALGPGDSTQYHRFDRAYTEAYITATLNGLIFKTDTVYYTYLHYLSTVKATYKIYILNEAQRKLKSDVVYESDLK